MRDSSGAFGLGGVAFLSTLAMGISLTALCFTAQSMGSAAASASIWGFLLKPGPPSVDYKDFVSLLLTALGLMIAIGAFFIAVFAFWGYREATELVKRTAEEVAKAEVAEQVPSLVTPELVSTALKIDPSIIINALRETKDTLFSDIDSEDAAGIVNALDEGSNEHP